MAESNEKMVVTLVALYRFLNFPVRLMHSTLEGVDGIEVHSIFFKDITDRYMVDRPTKKEEDLFIEQIIKLQPKLVGISVLSPFIYFARRFTQLIHENSSALVIWGGTHPTVNPESCIQETDLICIGEGEEAMRDLAIHLRDGINYHNIKNLWINNHNEVIKNEMRPLVEDLDSIPFPAFNRKSFYFIDNNCITTNDLALMEPDFVIPGSRGCPYVCSYCVNSVQRILFRNLGTYFRSRSVENIIQEIKEHFLLPNCHEYVYFDDQIFPLDEARLNKFASLYKKEVGLPFFVNHHPKLLDPKVLGNLVDCGLHGINVGIQSGSDYVRKHVFHRTGNNDEIVQLAKELSTKYNNVKIIYDLLLDNPYDNEDSLKETIGFLVQLPKPYTFNIYSIQFFPGYPITKKAIKDGHIKAEDTSFEKILEGKTWRWMFVPKLTPYDKKQMLQNIIWLVCMNHSSNSIVEYAVFSNSIGAKVALNYLHFKAKIVGGGIEFLREHIWISRSFRGIKHILRGDIAGLYTKIRRLIDNKFQ